MKRNIPLLLAMTATLCLAGALAAAADDVHRMPQETLKARLGGDDLVVVDVRTKGSWEASDRKVKGAVRLDPEHVEASMKDYPKDKTLVFYCS